MATIADDFDGLGQGQADGRCKIHATLNATKILKAGTNVYTPI